MLPGARDTVAAELEVPRSIPMMAILFSPVFRAALLAVLQIMSSK
jgi:hypothetical protein